MVYEENPTRKDDLGVPLFQETSIWIFDDHSLVLRMHLEGDDLLEAGFVSFIPHFPGKTLLCFSILTEIFEHSY